MCRYVNEVKNYGNELKLLRAYSMLFALDSQGTDGCSSFVYDSRNSE